jgi:hypothetical protein
MLFNFSLVIDFKLLGMKKIIVSIFSCLIGTILFAKTMDTIPVPEFVNEVYYYDKTNTILIPLEKTSAEMKTKMKIMGGGSAAYAIDGDKSTTRINQEGASFVITMSATSMTDPAMTISLYRFESRKGRREAPMSQYGAMGGGQKGGSVIEIKFKRVREGTFEIIIVGNLAKGEYGFLNSYSMNAGRGMTTFAFGVD